MQRQILILLIICFSVSCSSHKNKIELNFQNIDLSRSDGWHYFYSINVDSTKHFLLKRVSSSTKIEYFKGLLNDSIVAKITLLLDSINVIKYDSLYEPNRLDYQLYTININSKNHKIKTSVRGQHYSIRYLDSLVQIFTNISKMPNLELVDTTYEFESFKYFLPPVLEVTKLNTLTDTINND